MKIAVSKASIGEEPDDYLIELMGLKEDFPDEAKDAYGKIYTRYWDVMLAIAKGVTQDEDIAMDLLSDTFNMMYNKASTFKKGKVQNPTNLRFSIQKWMTTIMQRIFYDHFLDEAYKAPSDSNNLEDSYVVKKRSIGKHLDNEFDDFLEQLEKSEQTDNDLAFDNYSENKEDSENLIKVRDYMGKLSERDKDIILTFYNHYVPGKYTPTEVLDDIVNKWATTRENIRKILEKFRKSIKQELQTIISIRK